MQRVVVGGISGAGKTTVARRLAAGLDLPYVEMDALFHGAGWTPRPTFVADVAAFAADDAWVTDSFGYTAVADLLWDRADTIVWLDYPRWVCELRVLRRSVVRGVARRELWNGNRESIKDMIVDPEHPVRWTWTKHGEKRAWAEQRLTSGRWPHLHVVRHTTPGQTRRWLRRNLAAG